MECGKILSFSEHGMLIGCLLDVFRWNDDVQCYERALVICETLLADTSLSNSERCLVHLVLGNTLLVPCEKGCTLTCSTPIGKMHPNAQTRYRVHFPRTLSVSQIRAVQISLQSLQASVPNRDCNC